MVHLEISSGRPQPIWGLSARLELNPIHTHLATETEYFEKVRSASALQKQHVGEDPSQMVPRWHRPLKYDYE
uniref:Uncharacterized protein n=1 Tax=Anguilla anguilla TaxID=7936 RepID=A0A0E9TB48_ANGAN